MGIQGCVRNDSDSGRTVGVHIRRSAPMRGPWMRTAIAAAASAALSITPAVAREAESDPASGQPAPRIYGQYLVERTLKNHPELIGLDLHATPPNGPHCLVVASTNRDHVGRQSDLCALGAVKTTKPAVADDSQAGQRIEVEAPLQDKS